MLLEVHQSPVDDHSLRAGDYELVSFAIQRQSRFDNDLTQLNTHLETRNYTEAMQSAVVSL